MNRRPHEHRVRARAARSYGLGFGRTHAARLLVDMQPHTNEKTRQASSDAGDSLSGGHCLLFFQCKPTFLCVYWPRLGARSLLSFALPMHTGAVYIFGEGGRKEGSRRTSKKGEEDALLVYLPLPPSVRPSFCTIHSARFQTFVQSPSSPSLHRSVPSASEQKIERASFLPGSVGRSGMFSENICSGRISAIEWKSSSP